jgi:hypothetical protein
MTDSNKAKGKVFDPLKNYWSVTLLEAKPLIMDVLNANWVPNLISSPGLGKSSLAREIADEMELKLLDIRLSQMLPEDLNGFPHVFEKNGKKFATYIPMDMWPVEGTVLPINPKTNRPYKGWLVFLDEFNAAIPAVQVAAYKVVLDKMVGMHKLDPRAKIMTAGNLMTDKAIVNRSSTATQSRIVHFAIRVCHKTWDKWAIHHNIDHRVRSFLHWKPELLHKFDPDHTDLTYPCPRTWEMTSDCIKPMPQIADEKRPLLAGTIGVGAANEFYAYTEVFKDLPSFEQIIKDPHGANLKNDPSVQYALCGLIGAKMTSSNVKPCIEFLSRLGADFQVMSLRQAIARSPNLFQTPEVKEWLKYNSKELIGRR